MIENKRAGGVDKKKKQIGVGGKGAVCMCELSEAGRKKEKEKKKKKKKKKKIPATPLLLPCLALQHGPVLARELLLLDDEFLDLV
jgi:hypothetical protein